MVTFQRLERVDGPGGGGFGLQSVGRHAGFGGIFGSALGLNFGGVEDAVGAKAAIGQSLGAIAESIRQRIATLVGDAKNLFILHQVEFHQRALMDNRLALHIAADANMAILSAVAHLVEFRDGLVISLGTLDACRRQP